MKRSRPLIAKTVLAFLVLVAGIWSIQLLTFSKESDQSDLDHMRQFNENYNIFSLTMPREVTFCGEKLPMEKLDVRERLDRELLVNTYWQSNSILNHKRSNRWFPMMSKVLKEEGVPDDMKYLALIESGLTNVISPAGATGFWQFMKGTGDDFELEISGEVDERYHVEKATRAACKYLKQAHENYGSWSLAAASYNLGVGGVNKQMKRQNADDLYTMLLPEETMRYIFRAAALKEINEHPERYGFHIRQKDLYQPYRTITVMITGGVEDFAAFAQRHGTDYRTLKLLNPWLRESYLTNAKGRSYEVLLPAQDFDHAIAD